MITECAKGEQCDKELNNTRKGKIYTMCTVLFSKRGICAKHKGCRNNIKMNYSMKTFQKTEEELISRDRKRGM